MTSNAAKRACTFLKTEKSDGVTTQRACKVVASWRVGVVVGDKHRIEETTVWLSPTVVCNRHRLGLSTKDVLSDTGWQRLNAMLLSKGHRRLKRSRTRLIFKHLRPDV